jgi:tetratricopeptide (TPR) repeat protein
MKYFVVLLLLASPYLGNSQQVKADSLFQIALKHKTAGNYVDAVDLFTQAIHTYPWQLDYWFQRGFVRIDLADYHQAIADFGYIIQFKPNHVRARTERAYALRTIGFDSLAYEDYRVAVTADPSDYRANYEIGYMLIDRGNFPAAIRHLLKASTVYPTDPHALYELGYAYKSNEEYQAAIKAFQKSIALNTNVNAGIPDKVYFHLGECFLALKDKKSACESLSKAMELRVEEAIPVVNRECN